MRVRLCKKRKIKLIGWVITFFTERCAMVPENACARSSLFVIKFCEGSARGRNPLETRANPK